MMSLPVHPLRLEGAGAASWLRQVGLEDGDWVTATARGARLYSHRSAGLFALVKSDLAR